MVQKEIKNRGPLKRYSWALFGAIPEPNLKNLKILILPKDRKTVYPVSPRVVPTD